MSRDDAVLRSVSALHQYLAGSESLGDTLTQVTTLTTEALGAEMAGLLLVSADGRPGTPIYTDTMVPEIDQAQYDADRGPCLEARRTQQILRVQSTDDDERWPEFTAAASAHGIHSTLSLPLVSDGRRSGR